LGIDQYARQITISLRDDNGDDLIFVKLVVVDLSCRAGELDSSWVAPLR
jgi:hypothetical protein